MISPCLKLVWFTKCYKMSGVFFLVLLTCTRNFCERIMRTVKLWRLTVADCKNPFFHFCKVTLIFLWSLDCSHLFNILRGSEWKGGKRERGPKHNWGQFFSCPLLWDVKASCFVVIWHVHEAKVRICNETWPVRLSSVLRPSSWKHLMEWDSLRVILRWKLAGLINRNKTEVVLKGREATGKDGGVCSEIQPGTASLLLRYHHLCLSAQANMAVLQAAGSCTSGLFQ